MRWAGQHHCCAGGGESNCADGAADSWQLALHSAATQLLTAMARPSLPTPNDRRALAC